jgi:hypothetical protein
MRVVVNAGPLINLAKLGSLDLLWRLYPDVALPEEVSREVVDQGLRRRCADAVPVSLAIARQQIRVERGGPEDRSLGLGDLDVGERAAIQLALACRANLVLLDERRAREHAVRLGLAVTGTLGVIVRAYREGLVDIHSVRTIFNAIESEESIWISDDLVEREWRELSGGDR